MVCIEICSHFARACFTIHEEEALEKSRQLCIKEAVLKNYEILMLTSGHVGEYDNETFIEFFWKTKYKGNDCYLLHPLKSSC